MNNFSVRSRQNPFFTFSKPSSSQTRPSISKHAYLQSIAFNLPPSPPSSTSPYLSTDSQHLSVNYNQQDMQQNKDLIDTKPMNIHQKHNIENIEPQEPKDPLERKVKMIRQKLLGLQNKVLDGWNQGMLQKFDRIANKKCL